MRSYLQWAAPLALVALWSISGSAQNQRSARLVEQRLARIEAALQDLQAQKDRSTLTCRAGKKVQGPNDGWSPWSTCPAGYQAVGLSRLDLLGSHSDTRLHVNDLICDQRGCRAWCYGSACTLIARCCATH